MIRIFLVISLITSTLGSEPQVQHQGGCGPLCLSVICKLLGIEATPEELSKFSTQDTLETSMYDLCQAVKAKGLDAVGVKISLYELEKELKQKKLAIALVEKDKRNHFLVIESFSDDKIRIIDPPRSPEIIEENDFQKIFTGYALIISKEEKEGSASDIYFNEKVYDFGEAPQNQNVSHVFKFCNRGEKPLEVKLGTSRCCTDASLSKDILKPGESAEIGVNFNTGYKRERVSESVFVSSNDPDEPEVILTVTGIVVASPIAIPDRLYFGEIKGEEPREKLLYVVDPGEGNLKIEKVEITSKYLKAEIIPVSSEKVERIGISVTLKPSKISIGSFNEKLIIHTNDRTKPVLEIPIEGEIKGEIEVFPPRIFFGIIKPGEKKEFRVEIKSEREDLRIISVKSSSESAKVEVKKLEEGKKYELISALCSGKEGAIKGVIEVGTNDERQPVLEILFYALIKGK